MLILCSCLSSGTNLWQEMSAIENLQKYHTTGIYCGVPGPPCLKVFAMLVLVSSPVYGCHGRLVHLFIGLKGRVVLSIRRILGLLETPPPWHPTIFTKHCKRHASSSYRTLSNREVKRICLENQSKSAQKCPEKVFTVSNCPLPTDIL